MTGYPGRAVYNLPIHRSHAMKSPSKTVPATIAAVIALAAPAFAALKPGTPAPDFSAPAYLRSEEHTSELQSLMRTSYAVFCLKKKNTTYQLKQTQPPSHTQQ